MTAVLTSLADLTGVTWMPSDLCAGIQELMLIGRDLTNLVDLTVAIDKVSHLRAI